MAMSQLLPPSVLSSEIVAVEHMYRLGAQSEFGKNLRLGSTNCICSITGSPASIRYRDPNGGRWEVL